MPRNKGKFIGFPIGIIKQVLKGVARTSWLEKWVGWMDDLLDIYGVEDPAEVYGFESLTPENVEKFLNEHCKDLVESECISKIEEMIRNKGYIRKVTDEVIEAALDYIKSIQQKPEIMYGLPPLITSEIEQIRAKPELDGAKAYNIVYEYLIKEGCPEEDARLVAEDIKRTIPTIEPEKRAEFIESVITAAKVSKERAAIEWNRRAEKGKEFVSQVSKELTVSTLLSIIELNQGITKEDLVDLLLEYGYDVTNLDELIQQLISSDLIDVKESRIYRKSVQPKFEFKVITPEKYVIRYNYNEFINNLINVENYEFKGYKYGCLDWFGEHMNWKVMVYPWVGKWNYTKSDDVWRIVELSGEFYFICMNEDLKYFLIYICNRW